MMTRKQRSEKFVYLLLGGIATIVALKVIVVLFLAG